MLLREYLQAKGYITDLFSDGEAGYKGFTTGSYDLCVLDVMMPKKDGFTLAQEIRSINPDIPIIFLTAKTMKEDILEGFKIGADDYLTKPFSMEELLLRIEAILRRVKGKKMKDVPFYRLGNFMFDTQKQTLTIGEKITKLTTKECELLSLLCAHANEILERNYEGVLHEDTETGAHRSPWAEPVSSGRRPARGCFREAGLRDPRELFRGDDHGHFHEHERLQEQDHRAEIGRASCRERV